MNNQWDQALATNLGTEARLKRAILENERDALFLRRAMLFSGLCLALLLLKLAHHSFDLPGPVFMWELFLSLCS